MSLSAYEFLQHIRDEIIYLQNNSEKLSFDDFLSNET